MLDVSGISVMYGAHRALENAAVRVGPGEIVVILGANGAGKSSLLKAIAGTSEGKVHGKVQLEGTGPDGPACRGHRGQRDHVRARGARDIW